MIQRIQTVYMVLLILINMFIVISIDSNPEMSLPESHFGFFRPYINDYFFSEFFCIFLLFIIFFFKKPKIQINFLRVLFVSLIFGLLNFFDERSFEKSITDISATKIRQQLREDGDLD